MLRFLALSLLTLGLAFEATAQVRIDLHVRPPKKTGFPAINATVQNWRHEPITVCLGLGEDETGRVVPHPFAIQRAVGYDWSTLLLGSDVDGFHRPDIIGSGESLDFSFVVTQTGSLRLVLYYVRGSRPDADCAHKLKRARKVTSKPFTAGLFSELE